MKKRELRQVDYQELVELTDDKAEELANLKFQHALHQLDNTDKVRLVRRELAQMKTILREHDLSIRKLKTESETVKEEVF